MLRPDKQAGDAQLSEHGPDTLVEAALGEHKAPHFRLRAMAGEKGLHGPADLDLLACESGSREHAHCAGAGPPAGRPPEIAIHCRPVSTGPPLGPLDVQQPDVIPHSTANSAASRSSRGTSSA